MLVGRLEERGYTVDMVEVFMDGSGARLPLSTECVHLAGSVLHVRGQFRTGDADSRRLNVLGALGPDLQNILRFKFVVRSTYDSDLKRAKTSLRNIVSQFTNTT